MKLYFEDLAADFLAVACQLLLKDDPGMECIIK